MQIPNEALSYRIVTVGAVGVKKSERAALSLLKKEPLFIIFFGHLDNAGWKAGYLNPVMDMLSQIPLEPKFP